MSDKNPDQTKEQDLEQKPDTVSSDNETANQTETPKANEPEENPKNEGTTIGEVKGGNVNLNKGETINQNFFEYDLSKHFFDNTDTSGRRFSTEMLTPLEESEIQKISDKKAFFDHENNLVRGIEIVEKYGLLLIFGPGKAALKEAAYLVSEEVKNKSLVNALLVSEPLGKAVRINFNSDFSRPGQETSDSIIIFKDPLRKQNLDFEELLDTMKSESDFGQSTVLNLKKQNTFLIFILESENTKGYENLEKAPFSIKIDRPDITAKTNYFKEKIETLKAKKSDNNESPLVLNTEDESIPNLVANELKYYSEIDKLVHRIEKEVSISPDFVFDENNIKHLIRQVNNLKLWITNDIGHSLKEWSFVLSLGLLSSVPGIDYAGISLIDFELFRKKLEVFLEDQSNLKKENEKWPGLTSEASLLEKCRAAKVRNQINGKTYLGFQEQSLSNELWRVFTEEFSLNLIQIIPFLFELIEQNTQIQIAARSLGRIGEIDQDRALNWILALSQSQAIEKHFAVGFLFDGINASGNRHYIEKCERLLNRCSKSNSHEQLSSAVIAYKQIGLYRLEFAIRKLGDIVENKLIEPFKSFRKLVSNRHWSVNKLFVFSRIRIDELRDIIDKIDNTSELEDKAKELHNYDILLRMISDSISALCINLEPLSVLESWSKWLDREDSFIKFFFIKMLLAKHGVLDRLDIRVTIFNKDTDSREEWHYMVLTISYGDKAEQLLLSIFEKIIRGFNELESSEVRGMEDALVKHLSSWAIASIDTPNAKNQIVDFLGKTLFKLPSIHKAFDPQLKKWKNSDSLKLKTLATSIENTINIYRADAEEKAKIDISKWKI